MTPPAELPADDLTLDVQGRERHLLVVRPPDAATPPPAVLVFHGSNQTAAGIRGFTEPGFDTLASEDGAVVAYLDGYSRHWNDARAGSNFATRKRGFDDVAFTETTIDALVSRYGVDPERIYVVGFSNGAQLVIRLVHEIPERLAGAAILSATQPVPDEFVPSRDAHHPLPILLMNGTDDPIVPYGGGVASLFGLRPRGNGLSAPETAAYYAARNGIAGEPEEFPGGPLGDDGTAIDRSEYRRPGVPPVTLITVRGGGHSIPGRKAAPRLVGRTTSRIEAVPLIARFFGLTRRASDVAD